MLESDYDYADPEVAEMEDVVLDYNREVEYRH